MQNDLSNIKKIFKDCASIVVHAPRNKHFLECEQVMYEKLLYEESIKAESELNRAKKLLKKLRRGNRNRITDKN